MPATIRRVQETINPEKTLFIVASKSGTTTEPACFYAYFYDLVKRLKGDKAGENFIAITDPGTPMEASAKKDNFRRIFVNPSDIGGRYSALSLFGMVPAALMGLDVKVLLDRADEAVRACRPEAPYDENPGVRLGAALGALALAGRDKLDARHPAARWKPWASGSSSSSPRAPARKARGFCRSRASRWGCPPTTATTGSSSGSARPARRSMRTTRRSTAWPPPGTRSST